MTSIPITGGPDPDRSAPGSLPDVLGRLDGLRAELGVLTDDVTFVTADADVGRALTAALDRLDRAVDLLTERLDRLVDAVEATGTEEGP